MNELIQLENINAVELFNSDKEVTDIIERVQTSARSIVCDVTTNKGRKETASVAAKIARSKTYLDGLGKELVADIKAQAKQIDNRRKLIRDNLDDLKEEVRKPLTEFEEKEKARVAERETWISTLETFLYNVQRSSDMDIITQYKEDTDIVMNSQWDEYEDGARRIAGKIYEAYETKKAQIEESIRLAEENARLKKEAEERERKEREERIAREAAEAARIAEENRIKAAREDEQRRLREAEEAKLQAERDALEAQRRELAAANKAAQDKLDAAEKRETERQAEIARAELLRRQRIEQQKEDEKRHQEQLEAAAQAERDRIAEEKRRQDEEAAAREADMAHRAKINNEAMQCLVDSGVSKTAAKQAVTAIALGKVSHVTIRY